MVVPSNSIVVFEFVLTQSCTTSSFTSGAIIVLLYVFIDAPSQSLFVFVAGNNKLLLLTDIWRLSLTIGFPLNKYDIKYIPLSLITIESLVSKSTLTNGPLSASGIVVSPTLIVSGPASPLSPLGPVSPSI